jgi:hypothetical protein
LAPRSFRTGLPQSLHLSGRRASVSPRMGLFSLSQFCIHPNENRRIMCKMAGLVKLGTQTGVVLDDPSIFGSKPSMQEKV